MHMCFFILYCLGVNKNTKSTLPVLLIHHPYLTKFHTEEETNVYPNNT